MMENMIDFSVAMLEAVAAFFASEPIIYIFGLVCLVVVIRLFKNIITF